MNTECVYVDHFRQYFEFICRLLFVDHIKCCGGQRNRHHDVCQNRPLFTSIVKSLFKILLFQYEVWHWYKYTIQTASFTLHIYVTPFSRWSMSNWVYHPTTRHDCDLPREITGTGMRELSRVREADFCLLLCFVYFGLKYLQVWVKIMKL